jgi:hypothetical protein
MDGQGAEGSCSQTDSVYCDRCRATCKPVAARAIAEDQFQAQGEGEEEEVKGAWVVEHCLTEVPAGHEQMIEVMDQLQSNCIY